MRFLARNLGVSFLVLLTVSCQLVSTVDPQPPIFRSNKTLDVDESKAISGLLFGPRDGGRCCPNGDCCPADQWCIGPGRCCYNDQESCQSISCCSKGEECCRNGGCCPSGTYCVVPLDGGVLCCPQGEICDATVFNSANDRRGRSCRSCLAIPPAEPGFSNVLLTESSVRITWGPGWIVQTSPCDPTKNSRQAVAADVWFTITMPPQSSQYAFLNVAFSPDTSFTVDVDGVQSDTAWLNCAFNSLGPLLAGSLTNITVHINGDSALSDRNLDTSHGNNWLFNEAIIGGKVYATSGYNTTPSFQIHIISVLVVVFVGSICCLFM